MKLGNFAALDPDYPGRGLTRGGRRDKSIWDLFNADSDTVARAAAELRAGRDWRSVTQLRLDVRGVVRRSFEGHRTDRFEITRPPTGYGERREHQLVDRYGQFLSSLGHEISIHVYPPYGFECDLFDETDSVLYEAKGSVKREAIRMAVGQALDYRRFEESEPRLALLLPRRPVEDALQFLSSVGVFAA